MGVAPLLDCLVAPLPRCVRGAPPGGLGLLAHPSLDADIELIMRVIEPPKAAADATAISPAPSMAGFAPARPSAGVKDTRTWTARVFDHFEALRVRVRNGDVGADISGAHIEVEGPYGSVMQARAPQRPTSKRPPLTPPPSPCRAPSRSPPSPCSPRAPGSSRCSPSCASSTRRTSSACASGALHRLGETPAVL